MSFTQTELDALKEAYAQGVRDVWFGNRRVTYPTAEDMERRIAYIEQRLTADASKVRRIKWTSGKGL